MIKRALLWCFVILSHLAAITQPLTGTFTIGPNQANYPTIASAIHALDSLGVAGPVVFNIQSGVYTEQLVLGPVQGASDTSTITFQSENLDSASVTITWPASASMANNFTLMCNGASYTTFQHLTIERSETGEFAQVIDITNGSHFLTFYQNRITAPVATTAALYKTVVYAQNSSSGSHLTFERNTFENGSNGIWLQGISGSICCLDQGNKVLYNHFSQQLNTALYMQALRGPLVIGNVIESSAAFNGHGIHTLYVDNDMQIVKNRISIVNGKGIFINNTSIQGMPPNLIANNFIAVGGTSGAEGILLDNSRWMHVYHNSINMYNTSPASSAFRVNGLISANNQLMNNNLVNQGGGYALYVTANTVQPLLISDYNNLFVADSLLVFWQGDGMQTSLAAYIAASGLDLNSVSVDPEYASTTELYAQSAALDNLGTHTLSSLTPVDDDIDGRPRHPFTPDIGANEYSVHDLALIDVDSLWSFCEGAPGLLRITITNAHTNPFHDTLHLVVLLNGQTHGSVSMPLQLPAGDTTIVDVHGFPNWPASGAYPITLFINDPWDIDKTNDTVSLQVFIAPEPVANLGGDIELCDNQQADLHLTQPFEHYLWHDSTTAPTWNAYAGSLPFDTNSVWVTAVNARGCEASDTITILLLQAPVAHITADPSFTEVVQGDSITVVCTNLTTSFSVGYHPTVLWYNGATDSTIVFAPSQMSFGMKEVYVYVAETNGCYSTDTLLVRVDDCYFTPEVTAEHLVTIWPNPVSAGQSATMLFGELAGEVELRIFNIFGQKVDYQRYNTELGVPVVLRTHELKSGVYQIKYHINGHWGSKPLVIR